jgi:hypothetical protein
MLVNVSRAELSYRFIAKQGVFNSLAGANIPVLNDGGFGYRYDEGFANNIPIDFSFVYNGITYNRVHISTNGFIALGDTLKSSEPTNNLSFGPAKNVASRAIIAPLWDDIDIVNSSGLKYLTTGDAGSRIFTVEFSSVKWNYLSQANVISFQVKLYEGSSAIEFIYKQGTSYYNYRSSGATIGISAVDVGVANFISVQSTGVNPRISRVLEVTNLGLKPATGQVYRFEPIPVVAKDLEVTNVYGWEKMAVNGAAYQMAANISNVGSDTLYDQTATVIVSEANTFTSSVLVPVLYPQQTTRVRFYGFVPADTGSNTITVTVPEDDDTADNKLSKTCFTTPNILSTTLKPTINHGIILSGDTRYVAVKFHNEGISSVNRLKFYLPQFSTGGKYKAHLFSVDPVTKKPDASLWSTDAMESTGTDTLIDVPGIHVANDFFGVVEVAKGDTVIYAIEEEWPVRDSIFYLGYKNNWWEFDSMHYRPKIKMDVVFDHITLPVTLADFSGKAVNGFNNLYWTTTTEQNNKGFEVQRSDNGIGFNTIGFVAALSDDFSNQKIDYAFADKKPLKKKNYYRLKQLNENGSSSYSKTIVLTNDLAGLYGITTLFPNPAKNSINISLAIPEDDFVNQITITDVKGNTIFAKSVHLTNVNNSALIEIEHLVNGTYFIKAISTKGIAFNRLFIKY